MGITQGGVANSLSRIYLKLGVGSRIEAINKWNEEASSDVEGLDGD
jgi:DNA-binding NarL/FixJ family response regulator